MPNISSDFGNSGGSEKKKMANFNTSSGPVIQYLPAILVEAKFWYVEYYIWNPNSMTDELVRKRFRLAKILKKLTNQRDKRTAALQVVSQLNDKLKKGWNPFIEDGLKNGFKTIEEGFNHFMKVVGHNKRPDTIRSYKSMINNFHDWLKGRNQLNAYVISINQDMANEFIDHIYIDRENSIRTRKNYVEFFTQMFDWFTRRSYIKENPFKNVDRISMRSEEKKRTIIDHKLRKRIVKYYEKNDPGFIFVINYLFACMIRRTEMTKLRISDVRLDEQMIVVDGSISKNRKTRYATIPDSFLEALKSLNIDELPGRWYLISRDGFYPGPKPLAPKKISDRWASMRKDLRIPKKNQFYSLKDSGVVDYLGSHVSSKSMVDQAGWHSYDLINVYAKHYSLKTIGEIREKGQIFGS